MIGTYSLGFKQKVLRVLISTMVAGNAGYASVYKDKCRKKGVKISRLGSMTRHDTILIMMVLDSLRNA
jgi:hypothetical protein